MCGVFGFIGSRPDPDLVKQLGYLAGTRGPHGYGVATRTKSWTERIHIHDALDRLEGIDETFIGHARLATFGNHFQPIVGEEYAIAHNGNVYNFKELAGQYGLTLKTDCDSEIWLRMVESFDGPLVQRVEKAAAVADTPATVLLVLAGDSIVAYRLKHPLYVGSRPEGIYFCSRPFPGAELMEEGVRQFRKECE